MGGTLWVLMAGLAPMVPAGLALEPVAGEGPVPIVADGNAILTTEDERIRIAIALLHHRHLEPGGRAELVVYVVNQGDAEFTFGPDALQLRTADGELDRVDRAELDDEIHRLADKARFDIKLERSRVVTSNLPTYFSGSLSNVGNAPHAGPVGGYGGSNVKSARESRVAGEVRSSAAEQREIIDAWETKALAQVDTLALRQGPVAPGANAYGHVFVVMPGELEQPLPLTLKVDAGGRTYSFALQATPTPH